MINVGAAFTDLFSTSGIAMFLSNPKALIMVAVACLLLYLAIVKQFEPLLLLPIAFGMLLQRSPRPSGRTPERVGESASECPQSCMVALDEWKHHSGRAAERHLVDEQGGNRGLSRL